MNTHRQTWEYTCNWGYPYLCSLNRCPRYTHLTRTGVCILYLIFHPIGDFFELDLMEVEGGGGGALSL